MFGMNGGVRQVGVGIPDGQRLEEGSTSSTLEHCSPMEQFAVQFTDEQGRIHRTVIVKAFGAFYHPPNGEQWAASLRPLKKDGWLSRQMSARLNPKDGVPTADAVDVVPSPL